jgi:glycosyltransferase involved in cell wall biosynthesis
VSSSGGGSPKRVCHITTTHAVDDHRILHKECMTLVAGGYDVTLIAPHDRQEQRGGVRIVPLLAPARHPVWRMTQRSLAAYRLARAADADLYHFHDPDFLPFAALLARRGKKVIYDAHEDVPRQILTKEWIRPSLRPRVSRALRRVEAGVVRRMSAVVCADPLNIGRFDALSDRVVLVANYPRLDEIAPVAWALRERLVCYVGGISRVRGSVELVDAMAAVDARLLLAGPVSPSSLLGTLEARAGWQRVAFQGRLPRAGVVALLGQAQVGALPLHAIPNYVVALPVKLFEYMAAGIPVVASDVSPWSDIIRRYDCGLCVPVEDANALAVGLSELLDDPERARAMGERGRRAAEQHYSWDTQAASLLELYAALL